MVAWPGRRPRHVAQCGEWRPSKEDPRLTPANAGAALTKRPMSKIVRKLPHQALKHSQSLSELLTEKADLPPWYQRRTPAGEPIQNLVSDGMHFMPKYSSPLRNNQLRSESLQGTHARTRSFKGDGNRGDVRDHKDWPLLASGSASRPAGKSKSRFKPQPPISGGPLSSHPMTAAELAFHSGLKLQEENVSEHPGGADVSTATANCAKWGKTHDFYRRSQASHSAPTLAESPIEMQQEAEPFAQASHNFDMVDMGKLGALKEAGDRARARRSARNSCSFVTESEQAEDADCELESVKDCQEETETEQHSSRSEAMQAQDSYASKSREAGKRDSEVLGRDLQVLRWLDISEQQAEGGEADFPSLDSQEIVKIEKARIILPVVGFMEGDIVKRVLKAC